ncbi:hypothetical protein BCR44DRAFT_360853 [Catenaria anguillulae PL171]|uniref:PAS domain-containing protein n=1 Tax=Catenaria anguillulae PL171 TaxID=765915 RepID=A0A1Y2H685_9FUNG|nr:hypothetical protein BCR44DRAFT_360853 [Catenaria anguillulae PL171]
MPRYCLRSQMARPGPLAADSMSIQTFINQTIAPEKLEKLGLRIVVKVNGTLVYETPVNTAGSDTHIHVQQTFEMAGQQFGIECISTTTGASFYVTSWRYIAPALLIVGGCVVSIVLFQFLRKHQQLSERYSEAILQSTPNPMLSVDEEGRISGLNQAFLDLTGYSVTTLYQLPSLTDVISLCPPNSLFGPPSHHECDTDHNDSHHDHGTEELHSTHRILQPGKHDVRVWVAPATATSIGSDYIEATVSVSSRTSSKMSQVLVFTDVTEAKQRDAEMAHLVRMTDQLNAQQAHVLTYLAHELTRPVANIEGAARAADVEDAAAVEEARRHLAEMHQAVAELVGVSQPCPAPANLAQLRSRAIDASRCLVAAATISYSNLCDEQAATLILGPASAHSFIKFCRVAGALKTPSRTTISSS